MSIESEKMAARLREARQQDSRYPTGADAARAMGVNVQTYLGHENGSRGFKDSASRYADFYKINLDWLIAGRGPMKRGGAQDSGNHKPGSHGTISPHTATFDARALIEVMGMAECGPDGWSLWNGEVIDRVPRPPNLAGVPKAYAVYVVGTSMEDRYHPGELAYIHPGKPVTPGCYVLVQLQPKEDGATPRAVLKRLVKRSGTKVTLAQLAPAKNFDLKADEILSMHRVVGSGEA